MNLRLLSVFLIFPIISCDDNKETSSINIEDVKSVILKNQNKWKQSSLIDYSFTYQRSPGDCPTADELPALDINVEDGVVVSAYYSGTSEIADVENAVTINDIFSYQLGLVHGQPIQFSNNKNSSELPSFDSNLGYPISFFVDKSENECDAIFNRVSNFQ